jgi:hypothetical protein
MIYFMYDFSPDYGFHRTTGPGPPRAKHRRPHYELHLILDWLPAVENNLNEGGRKNNEL